MPFESIEETITAFYCDKMLRNSGSLQWTIDWRHYSLKWRLDERRYIFHSLEECCSCADRNWRLVNLELNLILHHVQSNVTIDTCLVSKTVTLKILMLVIIISVISQVVQGCKPKATALPPWWARVKSRGEDERSI